MRELAALSSWAPHLWRTPTKQTKKCTCALHSNQGVREIRSYVLSTKRHAIKLAADSAITILRVDQIIMAKQAGGPKVAPNGR